MDLARILILAFVCVATGCTSEEHRPAASPRDQLDAAQSRAQRLADHNRSREPAIDRNAKQFATQMDSLVEYISVTPAERFQDPYLGASYISGHDGDKAIFAIWIELGVRATGVEFRNKDTGESLRFHGIVQWYERDRQLLQQTAFRLYSWAIEFDPDAVPDVAIDVSEIDDAILRLPDGWRESSNIEVALLYDSEASNSVTVSR